MNSQNYKDKEFIDKVWQKVDRLEKLQEEKQRRIKMILIYLACPIIVTVFLLINGLFDSSIVFIVGIYLMSVACYFDNFIQTSK
ncbi:hypothetical protein SH2C18_47150 [Clostridium sediminicola]|uniref:hypothetical protein n=1 Tax=Clostridium sediminicola TaxID=3114879 RepID=UPI0031F20E4C